MGATEEVLDGARRALAEHGLQATTMERIAEAAGVSRMTLHRRGVTRDGLLDALAERLVAEQAESVMPALTARGSGRERLELALRAQCELAERNLDLMAALDERTHAAIYHEDAGDDPDGVLSRREFAAPLARILIDGAADGTLIETDPDETATVLLNLVAHTYRHLRRGHRWPPDRACEALLRTALDGIAT